MTEEIEFGVGTGIVSISLVALVGTCIALWRCCCGDNNICRAVNWCKGKSKKSKKESSPETETQSMFNFHYLSCHCCGGSSNVNNIQSRGSVHIVNETPEETVSSQQQSNVNSQPASNPSGSNQTVHPTAPPERSNENDPLLPPPNLTTESSSTAATSDQPDSQTNQTTSHQPQQQFTAVEQVTMPPSSMVPSSTRACFASQPTNKRKFSAKFVGDLGNVLDPDSAVDADWRLMLIELGQSQGEIRKVHSMRHPTEEALYSWQEAGRSLDELLEIYQEKRPDVTEVIERYKKNNACYAIPVETVQQTPRHETAIVTTEQLIKLAHNLGPWNELAINLGMSGGDIYKIKEDNKYDQWAQVFYMLEKWQKRESPKATVGLLYKKCCETKTIDKEFYAFLLK